MNRVLLTVDLSYQIYRACAAHPQLSSVNETFTGGLYGFLQTFSMMVREARVTDVVVCRDSKPYLRSQEYPQYKQLRKSTMDPDLKGRFNETEPLILELLDRAGIPVWALPGFEADDLAAHAVRTYRSRFDRIYAASNDSDLFQLLGYPGFAVFKDSIKSLVTADSLLLSQGVTPDEFTLSTALQGTHNDIEGIAGVGPKTALKVIRDPALMRKYRDSHGDVIDRNMRLIRLPHPLFPRSTRMPERIAKRFDQRDLFRWLGKYDIECTLSMVNAFEHVNRG